MTDPTPAERAVKRAVDLAYAMSCVVHKYCADGVPHDIGLTLYRTVVGPAIRAAVLAERERCVGLVRRYLLFNSQRAVSWHEVQDCIEAIRAGGPSRDTID